MAVPTEREQETAEDGATQKAQSDRGLQAMATAQSFAVASRIFGPGPGGLPFWRLYEVRQLGKIAEAL